MTASPARHLAAAAYLPRVLRAGIIVAVAAVLSGLGAFGSGCTAGQYDIGECDRTAPNLDTDVCNQLNTDPNDCMPYQCDRSSGRCSRQPRDYDRDGDPDSRCTENQGTDCYDRDPKISGGPGGACSCKITGTPCEAGVGACKRYGAFECQNNVAACPVKSAPPMDYQSDYYRDAVHGYTSEDWNCDGTVNRACCYRNSNGTEICNGCDAIKTDLCTKDVTTVCTSHCVAYRNNPTGCKAQVSKLFACNNTMCGARVAVCTCTTGGVFGLDCLVQTGIEERLRCR